MPVLIPKIATRKGGRRNNDRKIKTFYPFHFSTCLSSVCFLFNCSLFCSFPPPSPFCCHVPFSAILPFSLFLVLVLSFYLFLPLFLFLFLFPLPCPFLLFVYPVGFASQKLGTFAVSKSMHAYTLQLTDWQLECWSWSHTWQDNEASYYFHCYIYLSSSSSLSFPFASCLFPVSLLFSVPILCLSPVQLFPFLVIPFFLCSFLFSFFCFLSPFLHFYTMSSCSLILFLVLYFCLSILEVCSLQHAKAEHICCYCLANLAWTNTLTDWQLECQSWSPKFQQGREGGEAIAWQLDILSFSLFHVPSLFLFPFLLPLSFLLPLFASCSS